MGLLLRHGVVGVVTGILVMGLVAACLAPPHTHGITAAVQVTTSQAGTTVAATMCLPSTDPVDNASTGTMLTCPCPGRDPKRGHLLNCRAEYGFAFGNRCLAIYEHGTVATP